MKSNTLITDTSLTNIDFVVGLAGNPNVGKSTIFNNLTGLNQHTGNWTGKTVSNAIGKCCYKKKRFLFVDIPGTYSLMSNSEEEEIARNYICFGKPDLIIAIVDATCLERNLNLVFQLMEITNNIIVCVNLLDEARKKGIYINLQALAEELGVPVVGTSARKKKNLCGLLDIIYNLTIKKIEVNPKLIKYSPMVEKTIALISAELDKLEINNRHLHRWISIKLIENDDSIIKTLAENIHIDFNILKIVKENCSISLNDFRDEIVSSILLKAETVCNKVCRYTISHNDKDIKIDRILTSKIFGFPIMIAFLGVIFWLTIVGANYPSELLSKLFSFIQTKLYVFFSYIPAPAWVCGVLIDGMFQTLSWVISVMLPPMAIFFPLFTFLEDLGYLPRIAFNLDKFFKKCQASGKQALTMCMGFGCNACGVVGCRIISSPREKLIAILTNSFVPCNGRFPLLIAISSMFIGGVGLGFGSTFLSTIFVLFIIILGIVLTFAISKILSKTILKGVPSSFTLELPPYRKPLLRKNFN